MPNQNTIKTILRRNRLAPQKSLGQNFLTNNQVALRIVEKAGISRTDTIIELGVGLASLTLPLAARAARVIGLEIDAGLISWHTEQRLLPANVELRHQDLLEADFRKLAEETGGPLKIVANLPYSVSSPLLFKLLDNADILDWAVLMVQKEVAGRLTSSRNTKEYGILTVLFAPLATITRLFLVGPGNFHPKPKVDSVVIRISFSQSGQKFLLLPQWSIFKKLVKSAFQQRRKTLLNALAASPLFSGGKSQVRTLLNEAGIEERKRAENLLASDYLELAGLYCRQPPTRPKT
ncbi:MAG: 16S rRNA (adenine(1518)-N(6)/adenine(1519)-N(6))-dimethyltransferase RsmA [Deltaproteobacteria bacterium]